MANRRFEDFEVGRGFEHAPGRTVLDADDTRFAQEQDGVVVIEFERTVLLPKREVADVPG